MYKLYLDKQETFEANIQIDGASSSNSLCRLVVEHNNFSILFEGKIQNNVVKIPISSLKNILQEGSTGKLRLEIIADDTFFIPWEQSYEAIISKKVTAEVFQETPSEKKKPIVEIKSVKSSSNSFSNYLTEQFIQHNISLYNVKKNIELIKKISADGMKKFKIPSKSISILDEVGIALKAIDNS